MTEERVYIIMYEREEYCLRKERENPDFIFYWVASFLTDEP